MTKFVVGSLVGCCLMSCAHALAQNAPSSAVPATDMVYIPAGPFVMGTSEEEAQRLTREYGVHPGLFLLEAPKRTVELKAFWIDRFPVTKAQYAAFCKATGRHPPNFPDDQAEHPIANVPWQIADAYARWAGKRLPTAEEWEKAARGADGRLYPWGNEWDDPATHIHDPRLPRTRAARIPGSDSAVHATPKAHRPPHPRHGRPQRPPRPSHCPLARGKTFT